MSITCRNGTRKYIILLNDTVPYLKETTDLKLQYPNLDISSLNLHVFAAKTANIIPIQIKLASHLGIIILLVDKNNKFHFLFWSSSKCTLLNAY